jgi:hypothetical protein
MKRLLKKAISLITHVFAADPPGRMRVKKPPL